MSLVHTMTEGFSPLAIPNMAYWLPPAVSGSNITVSSGLVDAWFDVVSGGISSVGGVTTTRPAYSTNVQNGRNAVLYDGVDDFLNGTPPSLLWGVSGWTIVCTCKPTQNTVAQTISQIDAVNGSTARATLSTLVTSGFWRGGGRRNNADAFGASDSTTQASTSTPVVMSVRGDYTNTTCKVYLNDAEIASNTSWLTSGVTPNNGGGLTIGNSGALSGPFKGYIFDWLLWSRTLTLTEQSRVVLYERGIWAL